jgi:hypothetical protein
MALPVYSVLLWELESATGTIVGPGPPAGYVWVVRQIDVVTQGQPFLNAGGFAITDAASAPIFGRANGQCPSATWFSWSGRQVLELGDHLRAALPALSASLRVSGYQLATP